MPSPERTARRGRAGLLRRHRVLSALLALTLGLGGLWGVRLWHLQHEVDRYRRYWSQPRGEPGGILYVALGDSTALSVARLHDAMQQRGWASMLTDFAADWFHPSDRGYRVWAQAFWEATTHAPSPAALGIPSA